MYLAAVGAEVDEGIAPLLEHLAARGVRTRYSCQADGARAYIFFEDGRSFEVAVTALAELAELGEQRDLRARVLQLPDHRSWDPELGWSYEVSVRTFSGRDESPSVPSFAYILRMPVEDLHRFNDVLNELVPTATAAGSSRGQTPRA